MKPGVLLVHGFNVADGGRATTDLLRGPFEAAGCRVYECDYGWRGLAGVRLSRTRITRDIAYLAWKHKIDVVVGHSNGCHYARWASWEYDNFPFTVWINPALDRACSIPTTLRGVHVWYSRHDEAVRWAARIPGSTWGDMGRVGYAGDDSRVESYDIEALFRAPDLRIGHSDFFRAPYWPTTGDVLVRRVMQDMLQAEEG